MSGLVQRIRERGRAKLVEAVALLTAAISLTRQWREGGKDAGLFTVTVQRWDAGDVRTPYCDVSHALTRAENLIRAAAADLEALHGEHPRQVAVLWQILRGGTPLRPSEAEYIRGKIRGVLDDDAPPVAP